MNSDLGMPSPLPSPGGRGRKSESDSALFLTPSWLRLGAQGKVDQGKRVFEAIAEFTIDPTLTEHRSARSEAQGLRLRVAFSFAYFAFGEAKEK